MKSNTYDGLVLPGGSAPEKLRQHPDVIRIVKEFADENKPLAAICHGKQILISSGILKTRGQVHRLISSNDSKTRVIQYICPLVLQQEAPKRRHDKIKKCGGAL